MRHNQMINKRTLDLDEDTQAGDIVEISGWVNEKRTFVQLLLVRRNRDSMNETVRSGMRPEWLPAHISTEILLDRDFLSRYFFLQAGGDARWYADVRVQNAVTEGEKFFTGSYWMDEVTNITLTR